MKDNQGVAASPPGHHPFGAEPVPVSGKAGTPNAIGFTGSQFACENPAQISALRAAFLQLINEGFEWMRNGDCLGSDKRAAILWRAYGGKICLHPPLRATKRAFLDAEISFPPKEYLDRNRDIAAGCARLIATPQEMYEQIRSGTWATIRYARKLAKPILIVWPNGSKSQENWPGPQDAP